MLSSGVSTSHGNPGICLICGEDARAASLMQEDTNVRAAASAASTALKSY